MYITEGVSSFAAASMNCCGHQTSLNNTFLQVPCTAPQHNTARLLQRGITSHAAVLLGGLPQKEPTLGSFDMADPDSHKTLQELWSAERDIWPTHHVIEDVAVGRACHARVGHLNTSRRNSSVCVAQMHEYALAVRATAEVGRRRRHGVSYNGRKLKIMRQQYCTMSNTLQTGKMGLSSS